MSPLAGRGADTRTVSGEIVLPTSGVSPVSALVIVQVEDISRADRPSTVVGEQRQQGVRLRAGAVLPFSVDIATRLIDERHSYSVRVHVSMSASDRVEPGDFVSTQTYPVLTRGHGTVVRIVVRRV